jgi:hypothetical protein
VGIIQPPNERNIRKVSWCSITDGSGLIAQAAESMVPVLFDELIWGGMRDISLIKFE